MRERALKVIEAVAAIGAAELETEDRRICVVHKNGAGWRHQSLAEIGDDEVPDDCYLASGLFPPERIGVPGGRTRENVARILWLPFDFDLAPYLGLPKEDLWTYPQAALDIHLASLRADVEGIFATLGLPIHRLDATGYGLAAYVYLPDHQPAAVPEIQALHARIVDRINLLAGGSQPLADPAVKDAGSRIMRLPPTRNTKGAIPRQSATVSFRPGVVNQGQLLHAAGPIVNRHAREIPFLGAAFTAGAVDQIVEAMAPHWTSGRRHRLALLLAAMLAKAYVPEEQAAAIVEALCVRTGDDEAFDRLTAVRTTYARMRSGMAVRGFFAAVDELPAPLVGWLDATLDKVRQATTLRITVNGAAPSGGRKSGGKTDEPKPRPSSDALGFTPASIPAACLRGWIGEYVNLMTPLCEAAPIYHLASALAIVGSTFGRDVHARYVNKSVFAANFYLLVGAAGTSRKDTAIELMLDAPNWRQPGSTTLNVSPFSVVTDVASGQALVKTLAEQPNVMFYVTEYSRLVNNMNVQNSSLRSLLINAWNMPPMIANNSLGNPLVAKLPCLVVIAAVQPGVLADVMTKTDIEQGYANRWLLFPGIGHGEIPEPDNLDMTVAVALYRRLLTARSGYAGAEGGTRLELTDEAKRRWVDWYGHDRRRAAASDEEKSMASRLGVHIRKVALAYAASEGSVVITAEHLDAAIELVEWCWQHTKQLMRTWGVGVFSELETRIERALEAGPMKRRDLQNATRSRRWSAIEFKQVLAAMIANEQVVVDAFGLVSLGV